MQHPRDLRNWPGIKRPYLNLPESLEGTECYCVTIPAGLSNKLVLIDILRTAIYWYNWDRSVGTEGKQAADAWKAALNLPEGIQLCCCPDPTNQRYGADGILEVSYDGGETWEDAPQLDPRFNSPLSPPLSTPPGDGLRCEAAGNVVGWYRSMADDLIADASVWSGVQGIISAILAIVVLIISAPTGFALAPLFLGLGAALLQAGQAAFGAAMTEDVYDDLLCIVYCNTPDDGVYTEESWQAIKADILGSGDITGIAATFLHDNINGAGPAGLNNASRSGIGAEGDCDLCACGECEYVITFDGANWTDFTINWGNQTGGVLNCVPHTYPLGAGTGLRLLIDMNADCNVGLVRFDYTFVNQRPIQDVGLQVTLFDSSMNVVGQEGGNNPGIANGVPAFAQFQFSQAVGRFIEIDVAWLNVGSPNTGEIDNITINLP